MHADFRGVLDACVLANQRVCDLFLRLAETPRLYLPKWSEEILREVRRTHVQQLGWEDRIADYWQEEVRKHFPEAMIFGYEPFLDIAKNDEGDRHVLAAAICAHAELIVTFNLKHFPAGALDPFGISAIHPAEYLIVLYEMNPAVAVSKLGDMARATKRTPEEALRVLNQDVPAFAQHVADALDFRLEKDSDP